MKRNLLPRSLSALLLALIFALSLPATALAADGSTKVWKTETGSKYHSKNNCGSTNPKKARQVTLKDAVEKYGLGPCSKCSPPRYDGQKKTDDSTKSKAPSSITTTAKAKLYKKADSSSTVLKTIPKGTKLTVKASTSKYYKVTYDGSTGYVRRSDVK